MKKLYFAIIACIFCSLAANAQKEEVDTPYGFVNVRGGAQTILLKKNAGDFRLSPTAAASLGYMFNPYIGSRLDFQGIWNKVDLNGSDFNYKNLTTDLDVLFNITNCFRKEKSNPFNAYLVGGVGAIVNLYEGKFNDDSFVNDWYNFRAGAIADYRISRNTSVNFELDGNYMGGSKSEIYGNGKWKIAAFLGITFRFPVSSKKPQEPVEVYTEPQQPVVEETPEPVEEKVVEEVKEEPAPVVKEEPAPAVKEEVKKEEPLDETIYFAIREFEPESDAILNKIATWCKNNPNKKITLSGYADKGTGTPAINMKYSKLRTDRLAEKLRALGVSKSQMTIKTYGDTVQPNPENDKNRCVIIIGK